jgi:putative addiction module component (TIGR02574 family)
MSKALEEIIHVAAQLPREERLALAEHLFEIDDCGSALALTAAWEEEIIARIQAIDSGTAAGTSREEVMREAETLLTT